MRVGKSTIRRIRHTTVSEFDGNDQTRSAFELSNDGANKLVLDEIQYQLDFLASSATVPARRKASLTLIGIFANPGKNVHQILRKSGIDDVVMQLSTLLRISDDPDLRLGVLAMVLLLFQAKDGAMSSNISLSRNIFEALLFSTTRTTLDEESTPEVSIKSTDVSPVKNVRSEPGGSTSAVSSVIHRKRKFAGATATVLASLKPSGLQSNMTSANASMVEDHRSDYSMSSADVTPVKKSRPISVLSGSPGSDLISGHRTPPFKTGSPEGSTYNSPGVLVHSTPLSAASSASAMPVDVFAEKFRANLFSPPIAGSSLSQCGSIGEAVRVLWPVMFSLFTAPPTQVPPLTSEQQKQQDIDVLRLVLVNRCLTAMVNRLTTVSTSGYSSSSSASNGGASAAEEDESVSLLQELNECQAALRETGRQLTSATSARNSKTVSRSNSTSTVQNALSQQRGSNARRDEDFGAGHSQSFLKHIGLILQGDLDCLAQTLNHSKNSNYGSPVDLPTVIAARIHLVLGIFEAACYKEPSNQQYITRLKLHGSQRYFEHSVAEDCTIATEDSQDSVAETSWMGWREGRGRNLPLVLVYMLHALTPEVLKSLKKMSNSVQDDGGGQYWEVDDGTSWSHQDVSRFHRLFAEFAVHNGKVNSSSAPTGLHQVQSVVDISAHKLFASCLECLISITNNNEASCMSLLSHRLPLVDFDETRHNKDQSVIEFLVSLLSCCVSWRCIAVEQKKNEKKESGSNDSKPASDENELHDKSSDKPTNRDSDDNVVGSGALSPSETLLERCSFDLTLFLLSLLTNISEFSYKFHKQEELKTRSHSASFMNVDVAKCIRSNPVLAQHLKDLPAGAVTSDESCMLQYFRTGLKSNSPHSTDVYQLLIDIIGRETIDFLQDFVDTDEAVNNSNESVEGRPGLLTDGPSSSGTMKKNDEVPIAELILSSHAVLLLHTLTVVAVAEDSSSSVSVGAVTVKGRGKSLSRNNSNSATSASGDEVSYEFVLHDVRPRLPRDSWWLCIRILKAFMTLQLQTGIMLLENVTPVLKTIQSMSAQDAQVQSAALPGGSNLQIGSEQNHAPGDDFDALFTGGGSSEAKSTSNCSSKDPSNSSSSNQTLGEWKWNGNDFVWLVHEVVLVEPRMSSTPHKVVEEVAVNSAELNTTRTVGKSAVATIVDLVTDSELSILQHSLSYNSPPASKTGNKRELSPVIESSSDDDDAVGVDNDVESEDAQVEKHEESSVGSGDVEVVGLDKSDFEPLQWFNQPSSWKTYGCGSANNKREISGAEEEDDDGDDRRKGMADAWNGDKGRQVSSSGFRSKRKKAGGGGGGGAEGRSAGAASAVGVEGLLSISETERLFNAIVAGQSVMSTSGSSKRSLSSSNNTTSTFTQESYKSSSVASPMSDASKKGRK